MTGSEGTGFRHIMPFGTELEGEGVRFRLWAPGARGVEVILGRDGEEGAGPMHPLQGGDGTPTGWYTLHLPDLSAGSLYRFRVDDGEPVPDPASRFQPLGVHGPSQVVDPLAHRWRHPEWTGRPWSEAVFYELHVGTFSPGGDFRGVEERLDELAELGVTAVELMPVAAFPGDRGWGYDGVLPFAPHHVYGSPDALKRLVDAAHARELMVFLDVVYNHFGPEGNHLQRYAPDFFTQRFSTPWGEAIDFRRRPVREFFIHNALYWLEEYRLDGLRLDAVHAIRDEGAPHVLEELARRVHRRLGGERRIHLVLENGRNEARYLRRDARGSPVAYSAQWNDDFHHAAHVTATGESEGYYAPFADAPRGHLVRTLAEGFAFQGEPFVHWDGRPRGEPSRHLPSTAFVNFLQNHDQVGNRALGERLSHLAGREPVEALLTVLLLAPSPPLLFMGEEWDAPEPFLFFCDFGEPLAEAVREGRRNEFKGFPSFRDPEGRDRIPDPNAPDTFHRSRLDWEVAARSPHRERRERIRSLLEVRRREVVPHLAHAPGAAGQGESFGEGGIRVAWTLRDGVGLTLVANLSPREIRAASWARGADASRSAPGSRAVPTAGNAPWPRGARWLEGTHGPPAEGGGTLPPWSVWWFRS